MLYYCRSEERGKKAVGKVANPPQERATKQMKEIQTMSTEIMNEFLKETKRIVKSGKRSEKIVAKLTTLGYVVVKDKNAHHHLTHPFIGHAKLTIGCSPSSNWGDNFVREVRHAIWNAAA